MKLRRMKWAGHAARMWDRRGAFGVLVGRSDGRKTVERPRHRLKDNIKVVHQEVGWNGLIWLRTETGD